MRKIIKGILLVIAVFTLIFLCYNESKYKSAEETFISMDTVMSINAESKDIGIKLKNLKSIIVDIDSDLSRTNKNSLIYKLNHSVRHSAGFDEDTVKLIEEAEYINDITDGLFDISIGPVMDAWGFTADTQRVPEEAALENALSKVGMQHIHLKNNILSLDSGCEIDLGGIAKGYALEKSKDFFLEEGIRRGIVYMGGDILAYGSKSFGKPWIIAIQEPETGKSGSLGTLSVIDSYILTSGNYERCFTEDGVRYHHIIDPRTGYPADSGLASVTIVSGINEAYGPMCDALSTALFIMGKDKAIEFWQNHSELFQMILVSDNNEVFISKGLQNRFTPSENSIYTYEIIG